MRDVKRVRQQQMSADIWNTCRQLPHADAEDQPASTRQRRGGRPNSQQDSRQGRERNSSVEAVAAPQRLSPVASRRATSAYDLLLLQGIGNSVALLVAPSMGKWKLLVSVLHFPSSSQLGMQLAAPLHEGAPAPLPQ